MPVHPPLGKIVKDGVLLTREGEAAEEHDELRGTVVQENLLSKDCVTGVSRLLHTYTVFSICLQHSTRHSHLHGEHT